MTARGADKYLGMGIYNYNALIQLMHSQIGNAGAGGVADLEANPQAGAYGLGGTDIGKIVRFTGAADVSFSMTPALGKGFWCYLQNAGSSFAAVTLIPSAAVIDGLASYKMYSGEVRLLWCDGSNFFTLVLHPFNMQFTTSGSFVYPPGYSTLDIDGYGPGGGGGSGRRGAAGTARNGGGGGGGGAYNRYSLPITGLAGNSESITIAAPGAGGAAVTVDSTDGNAGGDAGYSLFGNNLIWFGGGGGAGGDVSGGIKGGGGGGSMGSGVADAGGDPFTSSNNNSDFGGGKANTYIGGFSSWGGGAGGGNNGQIDTGTGPGAGSVNGGCGGGSGGPLSAGNLAYDGGDGGSQSYTNGFGGVQGHLFPGNGGDGVLLGDGAGGGASYAALAGGHGGVGQIGGGGGGGAAGPNGHNSGAGGNGGPSIINVRGLV